MMMDVDQAAKAMRDDEMQAEIEDFLEGLEASLRRLVIQKVKEFDEMLKLISDDEAKVKLINNFTTLMLYDEDEEVGRAVHTIVMHKWVPEAMRTPCPLTVHQELALRLRGELET
jgi:hypothetical protein